MKNLSKVLAVVLALAMALSMVSFAAYTDVEAGADYEEAVTVLSSLGILSGYEDGSFKPEATITRAEFASVVIRMLGYGDIAAAAGQTYTDVPADHWANGAIALATQQGIISGYGDGRFGPEDPVKVEEAIKMVVAALGYTPMAVANGGYPGGYQVVASQKGILAGCSYAGTKAPATRATVAQMGFNALTVPVMEQTSYGSETEYKPVQKLLLNNHGVAKFEAKVTDTSDSSSNVKVGTIKATYLYQISAPDNNTGLAVKYDSDDKSHAYPVVDSFAGVTLKATGDVEIAAKKLIDVASVMYVKNAENADNAELIYILKDGDKNKTVEFMAEDIKGTVSLNDSAAGMIEVYTDKDAGETEEYDVAIDTVYINGQKKLIEDAIDGVEADATRAIAAANRDEVVEHYLNGINVDVKLLSNGEDEEIFNVIYITSWKDKVVTDISERNSIVYYNGGSLKLDETSKTQKFTIYKDGEVASFADIKKDDVLSIAGYIADKELKYGSVYIISEKVEGTVTGKATSSGEIRVDGESYKTTIASNKITLGDSYTFYVNARGVLIDLDKTATASNLKYGYVSYIYAETNFNSAQVRLLSADGKWSTVDVASKFDTINNTGAKASDVKEAEADWTDIGGVVGLVSDTTGIYAVNNIVAYKLNDAGEIDLLYMAPMTVLAEGEESEFAAISGISVDGEDDGEVNDEKDKQYVAATGRLGSNDIDDTTVIFTIDPSWELGCAGRLTDEDKVSIVSVSTLLDRELYNVAVGYNMDDETFIVPVIAGYDIVSGIDWTADFFTVSEAPYETTNEAGDEGIMLTGIVAGEKVEIFLNDEDLDAEDVQKVVYGGGTTNLKAATHDSSFNADDIEKGDVLLYNVNAKGEAAKVLVLVDASVVTTASNKYNALSYINATEDAEAKLGEVSISSTTYTFVMGYAKKMDDGKVTMVANNGTFNANEEGAADDTVTGYGENIYRFGADAIGSYYDKFTGNGKVSEAMYGDVTTDPTFGEAGNANDGDMIFARLVNGVVIEDFVIIANDR